MLSVNNAKKLEWLWRDENRIEWIQTFLKIADKSGNIIPFVLTPEQREFLLSLTNKNIVLKSRQLGLSVVCIAESIREVVTRDNCTCALISHNQSSCNAVFDKLKQQYNSLPEWIKPETIQNNRQALTFKNGSSIVCLTAGNKDLLRGNTITGVCHCSEIAFWKDTDRQLKALMQACSESSTLILESTANGFNKFSEVYYQAKNGENDFQSYFFGWVNGRTLFQGQYDIAVDKYKASHQGKMITADDYDEDEKALIELGATPDQIVWRRSKIATEGEETFHVEFPNTDTECFLSTGQQLFDNKRLSKLLSQFATKKPIPIALEKLSNIPSILRPYVSNKSLTVWKIPKRGTKYYCGVDCSEGLGQDYSTIICMDAQGEMVAQFKNNKIKPYEFADVLDAFGRWYGKALLTIEKASGGHSVIERLRYDKSYMNMTKYKTYDEYQRVIWRVGFDTNAKTKSIAVNDAREWFDKGLVNIKSEDLLNEMKVFVAEENGKMGAMVGSHDDLVMAFCLCIVGIKNGFWYPF